MKPYYFDCFNKQELITNFDLVKKIINQNYIIWNEGSGSSSFEVGDSSFIFFKIKEGVFIEHLPSTTSPLKNSDETKVITHYVGGEPMDIPSNCICDEETAFNIIKYFIENNGKLSPDYQWVDIFNYVPNRYE